METLDEARYKVEPEPYGNFVATPAGVRASLDDPERKENPARLSVTVVRSVLVSLPVVAARDQKWRVASDKSGLLSLLRQFG